MSTESSKFVVFLDGIKLPKDIERTIEYEINEVVMRNLAKVDLHGEVIAWPPKRIPWPGKIFINLAKYKDIKITDIPKVSADRTLDYFKGR